METSDPCSYSKTNRKIEVISYFLIVAFVLKTVWGIWDIRDLTFGDTSSYFRNALKFANFQTCVFSWSPLYTSFFGIVLSVVKNIYFTVIIHRLIILFLATFLIYEIARKYVHNTVALAISFWWIVLPINHATLYEVHIFSFLPYLIFWLLISNSASSGYRASALAILLTCTILLRNETLFTFLIFGTFSIWCDLKEIKSQDGKNRLCRALWNYAIPFAISSLLILIAYSRSEIKFPELSKSFQAKHTLNFAQIYSFGYSQRVDQYKASPWTDYHELMTKEFGSDQLSMCHAFIKNPGAVIQHLIWNVKLIPAGIQVALFNLRTGPHNPDYAPTTRNQIWANILSFLYLSIVVPGIIIIWQNRKIFLAAEHSKWILIAFLAVTINVLFVIIMQRPRPSYMFPLSFILMLLFGKSLELLCFQFKKTKQLHFCLVSLITSLFLIIPGYYAKKWFWAFDLNKPQRPLYDLLRVMQNLQKNNLELYKINTAIPGYMFEINSYLGNFNMSENYKFTDSTLLLTSNLNAASLPSFLESTGLKLIVFSPWQISNPSFDIIIKKIPSLGWNSQQIIIDNNEYIVFSKK